MIVSKIKAAVSGNVEKVWKFVTSVADYDSWRSDLDRTEILSPRQFVEYTKAGYATTFTITYCSPFERWEFDLENDKLKGHWTGIFAQRGEETEIEFTEIVTAKKFFLKPMIKIYFGSKKSIGVRFSRRQFIKRSSFFLKDRLDF